MSAPKGGMRVEGCLDKEPLIMCKDISVIWLVTSGEYSGYMVIGAFADKEAAEKFCKERGDRVEQIPFNVQYEEATVWHATIGVKDGEIIKVEEVNIYDTYRPGRISHNFTGEYVSYTLHALGRTEKCAIQAANDLRAQFIASDLDVYDWNNTR